MKNYCSQLTTPSSLSSRRSLLLLAVAVCSICSGTVVAAFTVGSCSVVVSSATRVPATTLLQAQNDNSNNNNDSNDGGGGGGGLFAGVKSFFEELDAFVDDASARRLGNGAKFYGKRKSNFYGDGDSMKKADRNKYDATEDYRVTAGGNYKWVEDENGVMRPVTRLKNKVMERDP